MIDYEAYDYSRRECIQYGLTGFLMSWTILALFYGDILFTFLLSIPSGFGFLKYYKRVLIQQRVQQLTNAFKDLMEAFVSALSAGYSMENAMVAAKKDLLLMYSEESLIITEINYMICKVELGFRMDEVLSEWGERSKTEDIQDFARIYATAQKTGGNLIAVMKRSAKNIGDKIETKREIETLISGKRLESKCMSIIPLLIILYLRVCSPGFLNPLYEGILGRFIMSGALCIYAVSFLWIQKIMQFEF